MTMVNENKCYWKDIYLADKGFVINLNISIDRLQYVKEISKEESITNLYRFPATNNSEIKLFNCSQSHVNVMKHALEKGTDKILILEDDFCVIKQFNYDSHNSYEYLKVVMNEVGEDWDVMLLGCNPTVPVKYNSEHSSIVQSGTTGTWAYIINTTAMRFVVDTLNVNHYQHHRLAIDDFISLMGEYGFKIITPNIPVFGHAANKFISTICPRDITNYTVWIEGNYAKNIFGDDYRKIKENLI